ncbi:hypothetical protein FB45DRAFT_868439 [Roridomyces roridus]|uniref:BTB domain-containing protein n=1 Tax=Roridomyces roridus TaxID=1738132 RepID=A0AAD7F9I3_9AGAR|nr:hypothetical protein FB45DRAFT_875867 [Roridomyces roridus]KAJ7627200.1 hypothetical protein FB45DRAFT_868439 [Roridomyces roridus]
MDLTRVDDLWFPEGGLVIQAGSRIFRVAGSILAARSSIFKDMLAIPQPASQPTIEGCPIVVLHDSPEHTEYFLKAIFDSSFFERPPAPTTFPVVAGVLRLSTKYDVNYLRHRALLHLATASPLSLDEYDAFPSASTLGAQNFFTRLLLANDLGIQWAMPLVIFKISCSFPVDTILCGVPQDQPTLHLPLSLQRVCLTARNSLIFAQVHDTFSFMRVLDNAGCTKPDQCRSRRMRLLSIVTRKEALAPLGYFLSSWWEETSLEMLCNTCCREGRTQYEEGRQRIWDRLPEMFGLPSWEDLRAAREADVTRPEMRTLKSGCTLARSLHDLVDTESDEWVNLVECAMAARGRYQLHGICMLEGDKMRTWIVPLRTDGEELFAGLVKLSQQLC